MPYIKKEDRKKLDELTTELADKIHSEGELNYVISSLLHREVNRRGESYGTYNTLIGVMECAKLELYRRQICEYEDKKIEENGDLNIL